MVPGDAKSLTLEKSRILVVPCAYLPITLQRRKCHHDISDLAMLVLERCPMSRESLASTHDDAPSRGEVDVCAYRTSHLDAALHSLFVVFWNVGTVSREDLKNVIAKEASLRFGVDQEHFRHANREEVNGKTFVAEN